MQPLQCLLARGVRAAHRGLRGRASRPRLDRRRRLVDVGVPGGQPAQGGPRPARSRPPRLPGEPRRSQRLGELEGARAGRCRGRHPRPGRRVGRPRQRRRAGGDAARGRDAARPPAPPTGHRGGLDRRAPRRAGAPPRARDHGLAGRERGRRERVPDVRRLPAVRRGGRAHGAGRREPVVGPPARPRADRGPDPCSRRRRQRAVRRDERQDHAGRRRRELHRGRPRAVPRRGRRADRQPRHVLRRPRAAEGRRHTPRRRGVPGARARDRRTRRSGGARRGGGGARRQRDERPPPPHRPRPGDPSGRHPAVPRARRRRDRAAAVGRERGADAPPHDPLPRPGALGMAVPVREPRPVGGGAGARERLVGLERRPDRADPRRREPHGPEHLRVRRRGWRGVPAARADRPRRRRSPASRRTPRT